MKAFTARWVDPNKGRKRGSRSPMLRAVCGRPDLVAGSCSGLLGEVGLVSKVPFDIDHGTAPARVRLTNYPVPLGYYHRLGPRRWDIRFVHRNEHGRPPGWNDDWRKDDITGHAPWLPCVIVCPVCGRDNEVPLTGRSVAV